MPELDKSTSASPPAPELHGASAARRRRGQWLALALFAFVIIVFLVTVARLGAGVLDRPL